MTFQLRTIENKKTAHTNRQIAKRDSGTKLATLHGNAGPNKKPRKSHRKCEKVHCTMELKVANVGRFCRQTSFIIGRVTVVWFRHFSRVTILREFKN